MELKYCPFRTRSYKTTNTISDTHSVVENFEEFRPCIREECMAYYTIHYYTSGTLVNYIDGKVAVKKSDDENVENNRCQERCRRLNYE